MAPKKAPKKAPKTIFLLADGTGNAAASPFKTNIWRLYQAIDQTRIDQITFYTDGVGTETFKPLRALGGAFGIGLARNVKALYQFLCRNYDPGDRIFLFGFSRGAFTVRILAGLILRCGILKADNEDQLTDYVEHAYSEYKRDAARRSTATRWSIAGLWLRHFPPQGAPRGRPFLHTPGRRLRFPGIPESNQLYPEIDFIGVWDTVDAYGMPIDALKIAIDKWFWPMTLSDRAFADDVQRACHALSLDDERPTFRPVLWTDPQVRPKRLTQVWFAGVHANVGGGYPDDGLAYVTMQWIMNEAQLAGARFHPAHVTEMDTRVDAHGRQYDSRAGLAGYYRYGPRDVDDLCNDPRHGVSIAMPLVHSHAWERISVRQVAYAPTSFPTTYSLADPTGVGNLQLRNPVETAPEIQARSIDMDFTKNVIWRRRFAYFATVFSTAILALLPALDCIRGLSFWTSAVARMPGLFSTLSFFWQPIRIADQLLAPLSEALSWAVGKQFFPAWVTTWLRSFANHPALFLVSATLLLWLFLRKSKLLQKEIFLYAEYAWRRA